LRWISRRLHCFVDSIGAMDRQQESRARPVLCRFGVALENRARLGFIRIAFCRRIMD
jgi:hypothetical protein